MGSELSSASYVFCVLGQLDQSSQTSALSSRPWESHRRFPPSSDEEVCSKHFAWCGCRACSLTPRCCCCVQDVSTLLLVTPQGAGVGAFGLPGAPWSGAGCGLSHGGDAAVPINLKGSRSLVADE